MVSTRGETNNNPGNIDFESTNIWIGLGYPQSDGRFCRFTTAIYGIRALTKTLLTYQEKDGCQSIKEIVDRWAPLVENDTNSYLTDVCQRAGFGVGYIPNFDKTSPDMLKLIKAIIFHENGRCIYSDDYINQAIQLA